MELIVLNKARLVGSYWVGTFRDEKRKKKLHLTLLLHRNVSLLNYHPCAKGKLSQCRANLLQTPLLVILSSPPESH